jgi:hypothetical protein
MSRGETLLLTAGTLLPHAHAEAPVREAEALRRQTGRQLRQAEAPFQETAASRGQTEAPFRKKVASRGRPLAQFHPAILQKPLFFPIFHEL